MDLSKAPPWFIAAINEIGTREVGNNSGAAIQRYCELAHCGEQGQPWCAIFANAMLEATGYAGTRSPSSQSFRQSSKFLKIDTPLLGAVAVFWREHPDSGLGHVGFYRGEYGDLVWVLGGNEGDMVQIEPFPIDGESMGLIGYYIPTTAKASEYQQGPIIMPQGAARHITKPDNVT